MRISRANRRALRSRSSFTRYAIYFTPQPGTALAAFGRSWFGRANDGATLQAFSDSGFAGTGFAKVAVCVAGRYTGLHALFKAPFCLRDGMGLDALKSRLISFASTPQAGRDRSADARARRPLPRASPGRADAAARLARRAMRRAPSTDFAAPPTDTDCRACASQSQRLSAPAVGKLRRSARVERVPLLHHAHRAARRPPISSACRRRCGRCSRRSVPRA